MNNKYSTELYNALVNDLNHKDNNYKNYTLYILKEFKTIILPVIEKYLNGKETLFFNKTGELYLVLKFQNDNMDIHLQVGYRSSKCIISFWKNIELINSFYGDLEKCLCIVEKYNNKE